VIAKTNWSIDILKKADLHLCVAK